MRKSILLSVFLSITVAFGSFAQEVKPEEKKRESGHYDENKFRQMYQEMATPNMFRTASGAPGPAYYQQKADYKINLAPTVIGIHTVITDRTKAPIAASVFAKIGDLGMKACLKKADQDGITAIDGATTSLCGAGNTMATGYITAAAERIKGNSTEPYNGGTINCVLHSYQIKDIKDELIGSVGTYPVVDGLTASVFTNGSLQGKVGGVSIFEDNNISVDSSDDAKGGVFAKEALVLVTGRSPRAVHVRNEKLGGGADEYLLYFEYAIGERSAGNWLYEICSDATAPSS